MRGSHPERAIEQAIVQGGVVREGERIVVACSGGPDSVALAAALHAIAAPLHLTLSLAHVNHGARASAWQDECVVLRVAADLGLPLDVVALDMGVDAANEAAMRTARYAALARIARKRGGSAVATAHHAEDQSETVLLALFRGTGPDGLGGMEARRSLEEGIDLIRPLLRIGSEALRYYCHASGLPYAIDPTNEDATLHRNAVREALQALRPTFPGLDQAVARAAELVSSERARSPRVQLRHRVREVLREQGQLADVDFEHVEAAVRTLERGGTGRFLMKAGVTLRIEPSGPAVEEGGPHGEVRAGARSVVEAAKRRKRSAAPGGAKGAPPFEEGDGTQGAPGRAQRARSFRKEP
ncbi:MAG TPA: tRNA lysidine(34) synthetase TilS [Candidatus Tyrphobacter sp.]